MNVHEGALAACAAIGLLFAAPSAWGQALRTEVGTSTLYGATGGSVELKTGRATLSLGAGRFQSQLVAGFTLRATIHDTALTFGDDSIEFRLPSDFTASARHATIRGVGVSRVIHGLEIHGFAGSRSTATGVSFFRGAVWDRPAALLLLDWPRGRRWRISSRSAVADRLTSIHSLEWDAARGVSAAGSAGAGAGRPYFAVKGGLREDKIDADVNYVHPSGGGAAASVFALDPAATETERGNVSVTLRPLPSLSVAATRQHLVDARSTDSVSRATVDQLSASLSLGESRFTTSLFRSARNTGRIAGLSTSVGRKFGDSIDLAGEYFHSRSAGESASDAASARAREDIRAHLSLLQVVTQSDGHLSLNLGGRFLSNAFVVDVGHQSTYVPLARNPFAQTVTLDVRVQLADVVVSAATYVTPDGALRYTVSGSRTGALTAGRTSSGGKERVGRFVVCGEVVDAAGRPVSGAAIQIGNEFLLTDDEGRFAMRFDRNRPQNLTVLTDEFSVPGLYEVVSAPARIVPSLTEGDVRIRVSRK